MARLTDLELAKAFVHKSTPSFSDVARQIEQRHDLKAARRRDLISGLRRVSNVLDWDMEACPADPVWLRPRLQKILPAAHGLTAKRWKNILSDARSALAEAGIIERDRGSPLTLSSEWKMLWDRAHATGDKNITIPVGRFVRFCSNVGIAPNRVSDAAVRNFKRALELSETRKNPGSAVWQAVHAWNKTVDRVPDWPQIQLTKPIRHNRYGLPLSDFPSSFRDELEEMVFALARPVLKLGAKRRNPLSPRTIDSRTQQWIRFASAQVRSGVPIEEIRSLVDILAIEHVEAGFEWLSKSRHDGKTSPGLHEMALGLCTLGRELGVDDGLREQLREYARVLSGKSGDRKVHKKGLTAKNRERLRQFRDKAKLNALLRLPSELMEEARRMNHPVKAARLAEVAVAIAIETVAPIRLKNLAGLGLRRHLDRSVKGRVFIVIPEYEVKNGAPLEFELPDRVCELLDDFETNHRPHLIAQSNDWLFARKDGTDHVHQTVLARRVSETIAKRLGVEMNIHLFRHLAAMLILERDPGAYDLVRRILGHSELSTTLDAYSGMESLSATRMLSELVDQANAAPPTRPLARQRMR